MPWEFPLSTLSQEGRPSFRHQPGFSFESGLVTQTEGGVVQLPCEASGEPTPIVSWWREINATHSEPVRSSDRIVIK